MNIGTPGDTNCMGDEDWKKDVYWQLQIRNTHSINARSIVKDYTNLTKQYHALLREFTILKNNFASESAYYSSITPANDKLAKLESAVSDLKAKLSKSYRDAALAADTFAYTSVLLKDSKQALDKLAREHYELEDKYNLLEKKLGLYQQKYTVTNQVAEDQQKRIAALQKKEDELAITNNHLVAQLEALKALVPPSLFEKSMPINSPDAEKRRGRSILTTSSPSPFSPPLPFAKPSPLSTSPTANFSYTSPPTPAPIQAPISPNGTWPSPPFVSPSSSISSSSSSSSVSPPQHSFAASEPLIKRNSADSINLSSSMQSYRIPIPALETPYDHDPNAANAQDLIAYAMRAHATSARAREMNSRNGSMALSSEVLFQVNSPSEGIQSPVSNGHSNGTLSPPSIDTSRSSTLSASEQLAHMGDHLTRFHSMPNLAHSKFLSGSYSSRMVLSGRPVDAHQQDVNCAAFHVSGDVLASGGGDNCVKVWGTSNLDGVPVYKKSLHEAASSSVLSIQFSPTANLLCGTSTDKNIYVWELIGKDIHTLSGHIEKVTSAAFLEDNKLASCSWDKHLKIFDLGSGTSIGSHNMGSKMNALVVGRFSSTLCTGHMDKTVRVFDHRTGSTIHNIEVHTREVTGLCNSPDVPTSILSTSKDNTLRLLDLRTLGVLRTFKHPEFKNQRDLNLVCFSPDGKFVVAGGEEGKILFWNTSTGALENMITLGAKTPKCVSCVTWNPKRNHLLACHDNFLYLYDGNGVSSPLP